MVKKGGLFFFMFFDDEECRVIYDNILDYYERLRVCDDVETKIILGRVLGYYTGMKFDDLNQSMNDFSAALNSVGETIAEVNHIQLI